MDIRLRKWRLEDAQELAQLANNKKIADNLRDGFPAPYTLDDAVAFLQSCVQQDTSQNHFRAIEVAERLAGGIGLTIGQDVHRLSAELGYWLAEPYWGKGIVTYGVKQMCQQAFATTPLVRIYATPYAHNIASCRVLEKAGFSLEGRMRSYAVKNGQIVDGFLYALVKD